MSEILVGRVGEELQSFDLDDIKNGAVRDSEKFPELFEAKLPPMVSGALISGVERKLDELRLAAKGFDFPIHLPPSILPRALEDSKEEQTSQASIVRAKLQRGFLGPVFSHATGLPDRERQAFLNTIAKRAQTDNIKDLIVFADDRALRMDSAFLEPLYGHLREHSNAQVREIFNNGHATPGKRVKETDGARLGILNSVYAFQQVKKQLQEKGIPFDENQYMDTTLCFVPMLPESEYLPQQGLIVKAIGSPRQPRELTEHDMKQFYKGRIFTYDHFDIPVGEDFPDWVTVHALKRSLAHDLSSVERKAYKGIDREKALEYLTERHSPGAAMSAFAYALEISRKDEGSQKRPQRAQNKIPKTVLTTGNLLSAAPDHDDLQKGFPVNSGRKVSRYQAPLSLRNLEEAVHCGQAFAVIHPDKYPIRDRDVVQCGSKKNVRLLREAETCVVSAYLTTMSTQAGASQHIGRPHLMDKKWYKKYGRYHPDQCNLGLTGDAEKEAYYLYDSIKEAERGLDSFDKTTYQHTVDVPKSEFLTEKEIKDIIGEDDLGYTVAVYGSSTGFADETYRQAKELTYELSKLNNVTTVDGGGARSAMRGMKDGFIEAWLKGYKGRNIGIRSETDVSPLEGNLEKMFKELELELSEDPNNKRHLTAADGQMHVLKFDRILGRQAAIAEIANAVVLGDGGKGSVLEFYITVAHNLSVNLTGEGLLGHSRIVPLCVANREIWLCDTKRGIYDVLLEPWQEYAALVGLKEFTGENPIPQIVQFLKDHAEGNQMIHGQKEKYDFDLSEQQLVQPVWQQRSPTRAGSMPSPSAL